MRTVDIGIGLGKTRGGAPNDPEMLVNRSFDTDTDWIKGTGWSIAGGFAVSTGTAFASILQITSRPIVPGRTYDVEFTVSDYASGGIRFTSVGGTQVTNSTKTANGTYTETIVAASGNNRVGVQATADGFVGKVDNISFREVL